MDKRFYAIIKEVNGNVEQQCVEPMIKIIISRGKKSHTPKQHRRLGCSLHHKKEWQNFSTDASFALTFPTEY